MLVVFASIVVHVRRDHVFGCRLDGVGDIPHQMRVAEVEADSRVRALEIAFEQCHQRRGARQLIRDHLERDPYTERLRQPADVFRASSTSNGMRRAI